MFRTAFALAVLVIASTADADTLIDHVNGIQVGADGKLQHFTGLVIGDDGKVIRTLGPLDDVGVRGQRIDGGGKTMLPGLIDAHGHVVDLGIASMIVDLTGTTSIADLQQRLRKNVAQRPNDQWIIGFGWNQELWPEKRFPTAADLDTVVPGRPVVLERVDGHAVVANSAAMKAAGITPTTQSPPGGRIENGLFVDAARALVDKAIPKPTEAEADRAFQKAQDILLGFGVTGVGAMSASRDDWNTYRRAGDAGHLRVRLMTYALNGPLAGVPRPTSWFYGDRLRMVGSKFFADGALGSRGAWLKQSYADKSDTRGLQRHSDTELLALEDRAAAAGFQIATHAIGDAANAQAISVYEQLARKYPGDRRWRIEHAQIVDPADIPRIGRAGIIASMQPTHQISDRLMAEKRLGTERLAGAYAWNSIANSGARLAFGSDYPVESPNPFPGLAAAISRQDIDGQPAGGWQPQEKISLAAALAAFTRGAAFAGFAEDRIGALKPGKWADFILIDRDPTAVDASTLARTEVIETWVAGQKAWARPPSAPVARAK